MFNDKMNQSCVWTMFKRLVVNIMPPSSNNDSMKSESDLSYDSQYNATILHPATTRSSVCVTRGVLRTEQWSQAEHGVWHCCYQSLEHRDAVADRLVAVCQLCCSKLFHVLAQCPLPLPMILAIFPGVCFAVIHASWIDKMILINDQRTNNASDQYNNLVNNIWIIWF